MSLDLKVTATANMPKNKIIFSFHGNFPDKELWTPSLPSPLGVKNLKIKENSKK